MTLLACFKRCHSRFSCLGLQYGKQSAMIFGMITTPKSFAAAWGPHSTTQSKTLDYTNRICRHNFSPQYYRAYWSPNLLKLPSLNSMAYEAVHCNASHVNLWDCPSTPYSGRCDKNLEAASVACQLVPHSQPPRE